LKTIKRKKVLMLEGLSCLENLTVANDCEVIIVGKLTPREKVAIVRLVKTETK
jgi:hypothetical protein